ncbi:hypothetical protein Asi03nite_39000 [Actinoplanes siamensis]|uniref:Phage integrase family protein n=1 Tax=Actinoplanes siamensis TaxID=1223317 RepID=A0A919N8P5_9ACTN|nr:hypothetical protein Asi03nite_39000 [Actinoplanes siamensis]
MVDVGEPADLGDDKPALGDQLGAVRVLTGGAPRGHLGGPELGHGVGVGQVEAVAELLAGHFYASGLIAEGCDVVTVQKALGHAKPTTTLTTYAHLWPTAEDRTRKAADSLMTQTLADSLRTGGPRKVV